MLTRERTSEVLIVSCDAYRIALHFKNGITFESDTAILEAPNFWGDERVHVHILANSNGGGNLVRFLTFYTKRQMELVLWLLERHQEDIYRALTK